MRAFYEGIHDYRDHTRLLVGVFAFTIALQAVRMLAIWVAAKAVGIDLAPRIYYVMGPLFFLVLLVPFTLNGFAVREAFFVSFLGSVGVDADQAFAAGFLFFLVTVALAMPGARDPALGGRARRPRQRGPWLTRSVVVVTYDALPWIERASRASPATRRSSSTTARPTARVEVVRERFPDVRARRAGEPRPRRRLEPRHRGGVRRATS